MSDPHAADPSSALPGEPAPVVSTPDSNLPAPAEAAPPSLPPATVPVASGDAIHQPQGPDPAPNPAPPPAAETPADGSPAPVPVASPPPPSAAPSFSGPASAHSDRRHSEPPSLGSVVVRYGLMRQIGEFGHHLENAPPPGMKVVVRTERGVELGEVLIGIGESCCGRCITPQRLRDYIRSSGNEYPFTRHGKVLRLANPQDVIDQRHLDNSAKEEGAYCRDQIRQLRLKMRLVTVEHLLGGERIIFYFTAEDRVDFRELVKHLAGQYRTRIEMRQVGARDEARLVADFERCGQHCCCKEYLKELKPVSMRMAKIQKATLDPTKISGRCGRLMCCLRYEDETYEELRKKLPRKNIWVRTATHTGRVIDSQIITQLVRLLMPDNTVQVVANEEILERDVAPPANWAPPRPPEPREPEKERSERKLLRDEINAPPEGTPPQEPGAEGVAEIPPAETSGREDEQFPDELQTGETPAAEGGPETPSPQGQPQPTANRPTGQGQPFQGQGQGGRRRRRRRGRGGQGGQGGGQFGGNRQFGGQAGQQRPPMPPSGDGSALPSGESVPPPQDSQSSQGQGPTQQGQGQPGQGFGQSHGHGRRRRRRRR